MDEAETPVAVPARHYHRYEKGLESKERVILASAKMKRFVEKMSKLYNVQFRVPDFRPVFVSKRLRRYGGLFYGEKIVIEYGNASSKWAGKNILWHEIIHGFVRDNWLVFYQSHPNETEKSFEANAFRLACNDGSHNSHNWKLSCDCGHWWKSVKRIEERFCERCGMYIVSPTEFKKIKKIAEIGSKKFHIDVKKYKAWKTNEKVEN
jgi:hypothetical protein